MPSRRQWRSEIQKLVDEVGGGVIEPTNGGHLKICLAVGGFVYAASSPSDYRAIRNVRREIKHAVTAARKLRHA